MKKKFIPIIGTISAGKSTFLQGFLGSNVFQTGSTVTTKFVCIIKNSKESKFYHVIPNKKEDIEFIPDGEEIADEEKIKKKIEEINETLSKKEANEKEIFYMLEIPIKNISNDSLLEQCYFMDIPGLNEAKDKYIDIIFSLLTLDDIKFEIFIFDSTSIRSDNIVKIVKKLEEKKCLTKTNNLFILNKIDKMDNTKDKSKDDIIANFKQSFYSNFEDDKKEVFFNITENYFLPINSLLLLAETKYKKDFYSLLLIEFCNYIENKNQFTSFDDYINKRIKFTSKWLKTQNKLIDFNEQISKEDKFQIEKSNEELKNYKNKIQTECSMAKFEALKKLFLLYKNKGILYDFPKYNYALQEIIKKICINSNIDINNNIIININNNNINNQIINENPQNNEYKSQMIIKLKELDTFLKDTFKLIDPNDDLKKYKSSLDSIRENIMGRKIRIAFIGNMNVGKTTLLNCIIGQDILPTNCEENTYRGIIIRHKPGEEFQLYKTQLIKEGEGSFEYYYFRDDAIPYRVGVEEIKNYINIKNKDNNIEDKDAYLVITGNLKIFDLIKLNNDNKDIMSRIEFIDLPGTDREENEFNKKKYYEKILKFSNCCVYVNMPNTINDGNSVERMKNQYNEDKKKIQLFLRNSFIKTCIFIINKSDELEDNNAKEKAKNDAIDIISKLDNIKKEDINISLFSGKNFSSYLKIMSEFIYPLENEPGKLFLELYKEYYLNFFKYPSDDDDFIEFIYTKIDEKEENFNFKHQDKNQDIPKDFKDKVKLGMEHLEKKKYKLFNNKYDEVIEKLYNFYIKFKNFDLSESLMLFEKIKNSIEYSKKFFDVNIERNLNDFLKQTDDLFKKELVKKTEQKKKIKKMN